MEIREAMYSRLTSLTIGLSWVLLELRNAWGKPVCYYVNAYPSQQEAISAAERKRNAGANWEIWAAPTLIATFEVTYGVDKKAYLLLRPESQKDIYWLINMRLRKNVLTYNEALLPENEHSVDLLKCSLVTLKFLYSAMHYPHCVLEQQTPFILGKDFSSLEDALTLPLTVRSYQSSYDYPLSWFDEVPHGAPNPLAQLIVLNQRLQKIFKCN